MTPPRLQELIAKCYPRWSPTMYKATLGGALASALIIPLTLLSLPFIEFFNGMAAQPKGKAQMTYGRVFGEDFTVARPPVAGTIPLEYVAYAHDATTNTLEEAQRVGALMRNPLPITRDSLERGRNRFNIYCIACHGPRGEGNGPAVTGDGVRFPAPPTLHTDQARAYSDGTLFHIATKGIGKMPGYADLLTPEDRWAVIHYVRALQRSMNPKPEDLETP